MSPLSRILERYLNILVPPPPRGPNVCVTCRQPTEGFLRCLQCHRHFSRFAAELADEVVIISMAFKDGQLARALTKYKNGERPEMRRQFADELAYVLATFLARHRSCVGEFDLVVVVPSSRRRAAHPLIDITSRRLAVTRHCFSSALTTASQNTRLLRPDEYSSRRPLPVAVCC